MSLESYVHSRLLTEVVAKANANLQGRLVQHTRNGQVAEKPDTWRQGPYSKLLPTTRYPLSEPGYTGSIRRYLLLSAQERATCFANANGGFSVEIKLRYDVKNTNESSSFGNTTVQPPNPPNKASSIEGDPTFVYQGPPADTEDPLYVNCTQAYDSYVKGYDTGVVQPDSIAHPYLIPEPDLDPPGILGYNEITISMPFKTAGTQQ